MTSTVDRFQIVADECGRRIAGCPPERWDALTPCPPWTASELVGHMLEGFDQVLGAVGRPVPADPDLPVTERWGRRIEAMVTVMNDPEVASTVVPSPMGDFAFKQVAGGVILHDVLVHTWDLARATGQDETLDPEAVASALAKMTPFDELLRGPAMFGPKVEAPPGADTQTRFLCFLGRRPW